MADQKQYIFRAMGPATKLMGVDPGSVQIRELGNMAEVRAGNVTPRLWIQLAKQRSIRWSQKYIGTYGATPTQVEDFVIHWAPYADTGEISATGLSCIFDAAVIPQSVRASVSADGSFQEAETQLEAVALGADVSFGTTAGTPAVDDHRFTIGPSTFNGSAVSNLISQSIDFGLKCDFHTGKSGAIYPAWPPALLGKDLVVTYETEDLSLVKTYVAGPTLITGASIVKFQHDGGTTGYQYTISKGYATGAISGDRGTITLRATSDATITPASY